jgi:hypothetical protein
MNTLLKTSLAIIGSYLFSVPIVAAQNWGYGGNYSQTVSGTTPQGKSYNSTVTTSYNQSYGAGGWMGTGVRTDLDGLFSASTPFEVLLPERPFRCLSQRVHPTEVMAAEAAIMAEDATEQESMARHTIFRPTGRDGAWYPTEP